MVGDIWSADNANSVVGRAAEAASIGTGTIDNGGSASDCGGHCEAQRHNRQTHSYRR
jgi:hypothetical protein